MLETLSAMFDPIPFLIGFSVTSMITTAYLIFSRNPDREPRDPRN